MLKNIIYFTILLQLITLSYCTNDTLLGENHKQKKQFSLFTIVTFPNNQCSAKSGSTTGVTKGTCYSTSECTSKGGTVDGNCASGFGVCCYFLVSACGSSFSENCTYIQNPGWSGAYTTTATCSYTFKPKSANICQLRIDFDKFVLGIGTTGTCSDSFTVTTPANTNATPNLCGKLTNQHLYVEVGATTSTSKISITNAGTTATWNLKVSQIGCTSRWQAPNDCAQYLTGQSGTIQSYGWQSAHQITGNMWTFCIRRETGYCSIQYYIVQGETIDTYETDDYAGTTVGATDLPSWTNAIEGYLIIPGKRGASTQAGDHFSGVTSATAITTDSMVFTEHPRFLLTHVVSTITTNTDDTGFYLQYDQIPCGTSWAEF